MGEDNLRSQSGRKLFYINMLRSKLPIQTLPDSDIEWRVLADSAA
jgi:hypothetical protein